MSLVQGYLLSTEYDWETFNRKKEISDLYLPRQPGGRLRCCMHGILHITDSVQARIEAAFRRDCIRTWEIRETPIEYVCNLRTGAH